MAQRMKLFCRECKEPTTHIPNPVNGTEPKWVCVCCEEAKVKGRTPEDIATIRRQRKSVAPYIGPDRRG